MHSRNFQFAHELKIWFEIEFQVTSRINRKNVSIRIPIYFCFTLLDDVTKHQTKTVEMPSHSTQTRTSDYFGNVVFKFGDGIANGAGACNAHAYAAA